MIAALHADKLALSHSVETKLKGQIAAESHNADLQRRLEVTENECMELGARLQEYKERGPDNGDAKECAAGVERSRHGVQDELSERVAAREEEIRAQCYTQLQRVQQRVQQREQAFEEEALGARIEQADETLHVLVALSQRVHAAMQQASVEQQQQQQQQQRQSEEQLRVKERLHAAQAQNSQKYSL